MEYTDRNKTTLAERFAHRKQQVARPSSKSQQTVVKSGPVTMENNRESGKTTRSKNTTLGIVEDLLLRNGQISQSLMRGITKDSNQAILDAAKLLVRDVDDDEEAAISHQNIDSESVERASADSNGEIIQFGKKAVGTIDSDTDECRGAICIVNPPIRGGDGDRKKRVRDGNTNAYDGNENQVGYYGRGLPTPRPRFTYPPPLEEALRLGSAPTFPSNQDNLWQIAFQGDMYIDLLVNALYLALNPGEYHDTYKNQFAKKDLHGRIVDVSRYLGIELYQSLQRHRFLTSQIEHIHGYAIKQNITSDDMKHPYNRAIQELYDLVIFHAGESGRNFR